MERDNIKSRWINIGKCLAIIAVITDHTNGILYSNQDIAYSSYYYI